MQKKKRKEINIAEVLLQWSSENPRDLPWKKSGDPYTIWVSEVILQQTRIEQGKPYFLKFIRHFPNLQSLAEAPEDVLMKVWEGLGYYRRAKHMHEAAKYIIDRYDGKFPDNYGKILTLKGVGAYTAAAIAAFAFKQPYVVVDGNVIRVISRLYGIIEFVDTIKGQKKIKSLAQQILPVDQSDKFNQAIMDFGALHCKPVQPSCTVCPLNVHCIAYNKNLVMDIPLKQPSRPKKKRFFQYILVHDDNSVWVRKRKAKDIWQNLYEFYLVENQELQPVNELLNSISFPFTLLHHSKPYQQILSHQHISANFTEIHVQVKPRSIEEMGYMPINRKKIRNFAFPKIIDWYIKDISLNLD